MNLDLLAQTPWAIWLILALIFAILEVGVPMFAFSFVSLAALITTLVSLKWGRPVQAVVFLLATLVSFLVLRPRLQGRWLRHRAHAMPPSRADALVGKEGVVSEAIDSANGMGRVMVEGQDWAAKSQNAISIGKPIKVEKHDGIVLIIKEIEPWNQQ